MGLLFSRFINRFSANREVRILMLGLDAAGKTTILYKLKLGDVITTIPTIGFNVETVEYKRINLTVWDIGGLLNIRPLWRHYCDNTQGIIFVVDSGDPDRFDEARNELHSLTREKKLQGVPLLVFANKRDLPHAMSATAVAEKLELGNLQNRSWFIQSSCAASGRGLYDGLDWLCDSLTHSGSSR